MSETPKYVIQLEHIQDINGELTSPIQYNIKDKALTDRVGAIENILAEYHGKSNNGTGTISDDWINNNSTQEGIYIVTDSSGVQLYQSQFSYGAIETLWNDYPSADSETESYINYDNNLYTNTQDIALPAILLIGHFSQDTSERTASIVDANGLIWRRYSYSITDTNDQQVNSYYWINIFDDKANIQDFRKLSEIVYNQELAIKDLQEDLKNLKF